jgi:adenylate kinase
MKGSFNKKAVIIYGPPGAGKGTLAALLNKDFDYFYFDTGQYLRKLLYNPKLRDNKTIQKERLLNESGKLNTPAWVLEIVSQEAKRIMAVGWSIIFAGSPRTLFESFGDARHEGLMKILKRFYGLKNIFIFKLKIRDKTSIKRNSHRVICEICGQPSLFLYTGKLRCCAFCAGPLKKRPDDDLKVIKTRLIEYRERTLPIIKKLKEKGFQVFEIDAEPAPYKIYQKIVQRIK